MSDLIEGSNQEAPEVETPNSGLNLRWVIVPVVVIILVVVVVACAPAAGNVYSNIVNAL